MTEDQIKHMVNRFLGWRLPENFQPDGGVSFKAIFNEHTAHEGRHQPTGTNLFDAAQAEAMVRHMLDGLNAEVGATNGWQPIETAPTDGTTIDIWVAGYPNRRLVNMKWDVHEYGFRNYADPEQGWMEDEEITHWMLPSTPADDTHGLNPNSLEREEI